MKYIRMPIEAESPEEFGYDKIRYNLTESSVTDRKLRDVLVNLEDIVLCYGDHIGHPQLRQLIANTAAGLQADDILLTAGASSALYIIATSLLEKGDHIVVARPNYATNIETPRAIACDISFLDLQFDNQYQLDVSALAKLIRPETKYVSLTYPHNPTGVMIKEQTLLDVIQLVEEKGCYLLLDETYREMTFGKTLALAASLSQRVISVSSLSKTYGIPGIRLGWLITQNKDLQNLFLCAKEQIGICGSVVDEAIAYEAYRHRDIWLKENNQRIQAAFLLLKKWVAGEKWIEWVEPSGGCVCFPRIDPTLAIDIDLFYELLNNKYGTYVGPGHWFEQSRRHFRIGYAWTNLEDLEQGLNNISKVLLELEK